MFIAGSGLIDTEVIWNFALITVAASTLPNLFGMFLLRKEMKTLLKRLFKIIFQNHSSNKFSKKASSKELSSREFNLPLLPEWPPTKFIFKRIGLLEMLFSLNLGTYLAGSKY